MEKRNKKDLNRKLMGRIPLSERPPKIIRSKKKQYLQKIQKEELDEDYEDYYE